MSQSDTSLYFQHGGVKVTSQTLSTRFKDEDLAPIQSVQIGRDPLWIGGVMSLGLGAFALQFGDVLWGYERFILGLLAFLALGGGVFTGTLYIGQHMRERLVYIGPLWKVTAIRAAIFQAKNNHKAIPPMAIIDSDTD